MLPKIAGAITEKVLQEAPAKGEAKRYQPAAETIDEKPIKRWVSGLQSLNQDLLDVWDEDLKKNKEQQGMSEMGFVRFMGLRG